MGTLIDRYGEIYGDYAAPYGTPYEQRSIPYIQNSHAYHVYHVIKPIDNVTTSIIASAFDQAGGGIQYQLPKSIKDLLGEYLGEVKS